MATSRFWYLIHTRPRQESVAKTHLERQGFVTYLPLAKTDNRNRLVTSPLFPRYLFVRPPHEGALLQPVRSTRGVNTLVCIGQEPARIPERVISTLREQEDGDGFHRISDDGPHPGDPVRLKSGPLAGYGGIFYEQKGENRAIILLGMLGKECSIEVPRGCFTSVK